MRKMSENISFCFSCTVFINDKLPILTLNDCQGMIHVLKIIFSSSRIIFEIDLNVWNIPSFQWKRL